MSELTVTDQFCGAGGSSIGAASAGAVLALGLNHNRLAIETHSTNFPEALHDCADVSQVDPRRYPTTDILLTSPECTNHSAAKNHNQASQTLQLWDPKKDAERSRATMWDVPRFAEYHRYTVIVVENVVEVRSWAPFDSWLSAMDSLGYQHQFVYLNSMFTPPEPVPVPQSRDRLYTVFVRTGCPFPDLDFRPAVVCPVCGPVEAVQHWKSDFHESFARATRKLGRRPDRLRWGLYRQQYDYRCPSCAQIVEPDAFPALVAIDFSLPSQRIGDRDRPLVAATMDRIQRGIDKYGAYPMLVPLSHTQDGGRTKQVRPASQPFFTQSTRAEVGLAHPFMHQLAGHAFEREDSTCRSRSVHDVMPTQTTTATEGMILVPHVDTARAHATPAPATAPVDTVTAGGNHHYLLEMPVPLVDSYYRTGTVKPATEPVGTVSTHERHGLVQLPGAFYVKNYGKGDDPSMTHPVTDPLGAVTTQDHHGLTQYEPAVKVAIEDCYYRMFEPCEIQRAMAFPESYRVLGDKRAKVRQLGNAVTPPVMSLLLKRIVPAVFQ